MPITPVNHEFDWGHGPRGYFAPEDYLGGPNGLKRLVDAAPARGIPIVLDGQAPKTQRMFGSNTRGSGTDGISGTN
jgi:glycosidase